MEAPDNLQYTKEHEWINIDGNIATIGITDYAQEQLGDIVFVELPSVDEEVREGDVFGAVESVKSVSDCLSPVTGKILEVNDLLLDNPELINGDCYGEGWMLRVEIEAGSVRSELMDSAAYVNFVKEESE